MPKIKKTTLFVEVDDKEFTVSYSGTLAKPHTREELKHNERLIKILISDDKLMDFFYNIVNPAVRYRKNKARKERKGKAISKPL